MEPRVKGDIKQKEDTVVKNSCSRVKVIPFSDYLSHWSQTATTQNPGTQASTSTQDQSPRLVGVTRQAPRVRPTPQPQIEPDHVNWEAEAEELVKWTRALSPRLLE